MKKMLTLFIMACLAFLLSSCHDDEETHGGRRRGQVVETYKVAIVMPSSQQSRWENVAQWALENLEIAQDTLQRRVKLELEWFDEDNTEGLPSFISRVDADPQFKAIIGPMKTDNAYTAAAICAQHETTLILPQCTSAELQRLYAESPYVFHLTQSDIGQIEVMLSCALARKAKSVSLLVNHDDVRAEASSYSYGSTFRNWLGFFACEAGLKVDTVCTYTDDASLYNAVDDLVELYSSTAHDTINSVLLFVPKTPQELVRYDEISCNLTSRPGKGRNYPFTLCSDASVGDELTHSSIGRDYEGIDIAAAATSGFVPAYHSFFGSNNDPIGGEAQLFDALYMLTYALTINPDDVNGSIVKLVDAEDLVYFSWLPTDARLFFSLLQKGVVVSPAGALGDWTFDKRYHASLLNTTYRHWKLSDNQYTTIQYITLEDTRRSVSNEQLWQLNANVEDSFDPSQIDSNYGECTGNYAVVVAASTGWRNYRHQADALDVYQMLKQYGYDDDHIIFILEGDIVNDEHNIHRGEVRVFPDGENLYHDVTIDYRPSQLRSEDLFNILTGQQSQRTPTVLPSTATDNVFLFWSGHGQDGALFLDRDDIYDRQFKELLASMQQQGKFRKLFFVTEACYSGSIAQECEGERGVLLLTAANASESSKADIMDPQMNIWLSNGFTRAFCEAVKQRPDITMRNLYYHVARQTVGSHATMYNYQHYGNMFTNSFSEFLPAARQ